MILDGVGSTDILNFQSVSTWRLSLPASMSHGLATVRKLVSFGLFLPCPLTMRLSVASDLPLHSSIPQFSRQARHNTTAYPSVIPDSWCNTLPIRALPTTSSSIPPTGISFLATSLVSRACGLDTWLFFDLTSLPVIFLTAL
jgi:hypothetical protein